MFEVEPTMVRIGEGLKLSQRGERDAARRVFAEIWSDIGEDSGDPLHRCTLAHAMADVQDDAAEELLWDLRALEAVGLISDERAAEAGVIPYGGRVVKTFLGQTNVPTGEPTARRSQEALAGFLDQCAGATDRAVKAALRAACGRP